AMEAVYETLPKDVPHGWKYLAFGPDGKLYFNIGAPCNICIPPDTHANISRINPDGTGFEYWAHGVRNSVGFDWHPVTKELYFTTHGRDWLGEDVPNDRLDVAPKKGLHFGYPYCHQGDILDPEFGKGRSCGEFAAPLLKTGPHVAGNGVEFYTGSMFPPEYKNRMFLAQRGSWNRTKKSGFRVMMVTLRSGDVPKYEVFAEGWLQGEEIWGRPVYTRQMKDGSLLIADDYAGAIYRVSYQPSAGCQLFVVVPSDRGLGARRRAGPRRPRGCRGQRSGPAKGRGVRRVPRPRRQRLHPRLPLARRPARVLHPLAAHQVPGRAARGSADVAVRPEPERHRYGRPGRLLPGAAAEAAPGDDRPRQGRRGAAARRRPPL